MMIILLIFLCWTLQGSAGDQTHSTKAPSATPGWRIRHSLAGADTPRLAQALARWFAPSFYCERRTEEDQFIFSIDYLQNCEPHGFSPSNLPCKIPRSTDPRTVRAAEVLLGVGAAAGPPPSEPNSSFRLVQAAHDADAGTKRMTVGSREQPRTHAIYVSVRPISLLASTGQPPIQTKRSHYYCIAYFVLLPFNRAPLDERLRLWKTFDHEGDLESVQEAVEINEEGNCRILEIVMGNHGRRILALPDAIEFDNLGPAGLHPRIWLDEGSHEPYPFQGKHGVLTGRKGVFYTATDKDFSGLRELFLPHNAAPTEANVIRPTEIHFLPATNLSDRFSPKAFLKKSLSKQDAEFFMRFPGLYGKDDSPAGPNWNMWDLFQDGTNEFHRTPPERAFAFEISLEQFASRARSLVAEADTRLKKRLGEYESTGNILGITGDAHASGTLKLLSTTGCQLERAGEKVGAIEIRLQLNARAKFDAIGRKWWEASTEQVYRVIYVPRTEKGRLLLEPGFEVIYATPIENGEASQSRPDAFRDEIKTGVLRELKEQMHTIELNTELAKKLNLPEVPPVIGRVQVLEDGLRVIMDPDAEDGYATFATSKMAPQSSGQSLKELTDEHRHN
jgi:hypothetical protein